MKELKMMFNIMVNNVFQFLLNRGFSIQETTIIRKEAEERKRNTSLKNEVVLLVKKIDTLAKVKTAKLDMLESLKAITLENNVLEQESIELQGTATTLLKELI